MKYLQVGAETAASTDGRQHDSCPVTHKSSQAAVEQESGDNGRYSDPVRPRVNRDSVPAAARLRLLFVNLCSMMEAGLTEHESAQTNT